MRVTMIGTGYVGLVSGACFADFGHTVTCVDKDASKIERLQKGEIPIFEPGLDELVKDNVEQGRLSFTTDPTAAIRDADAIFIAVGTPSRRGDGHADLSYVYAAAEEIAGLMNGYTVVVTKSTVPVGTGDEVEAIIKKTNPSADFAVVSNPEFLREGAAIGDFKRPDRVVVARGFHERQRVLREARAAIARAGVQEFAADAVVEADALGDFLHIGANCFAEIGDLVDEGDLHRQKAVAGVLDQLRRAALGEHDWRFVEKERAIELAHHFARAFVIGADDDAIRALEVADGRALAQEFRV